MSSFVNAMHQLVGIGQWQRKSGGSTVFMVVWCMVASTILGFGFWTMNRMTQDVFEMLPVLQARPIRAASDEELGKGIFQGALHGPARNAPSGAKAVAWYAWVDRVVTRGKNTSRERLCTLHELEGLTLEQGGKRTPLELQPSTFEVIGPGGLGSPRVGHVELFGSVAQSSPPAAVLGRPECKSPDDARLEYNEIVWTDGRELVVSGLRDAKGIGPSGAGADFIASECGGSNDGCTDAKRGKDFVLRSWVKAVTWSTTIAFVLVGLFTTVVGGINLWRHRALQKQRRTIARRLA